MDNSFRYYQVNYFKTVLVILLVLAWSCKQAPKSEKQILEEVKQETEAVQKLSPIAKDLASFAGLSVTDTTDLDQLIIFKKINENEDVESIDLDSYLALHKKVIKEGQKTALPIFELRHTDKSIITFAGKGFTGPIWGHALVNRKTQKIEKIQFDHKGESEGYGAQMTRNSFEERFADAVISRKANSFGLDQGGKEIIMGKRVIDGISGATTTSRTVIDMINEGLKIYGEYLSQND
jgi:Na+-transporting NADH:ubiquinone oxidoreductase subunit C